MYNSLPRRGIRAVALAFLTLSALLAGAGCGKDSGGGPTDPAPSDPAPSDPGPSDPGPGPQGPAPVGDVIYAVDLANNFLVFGTGSINVLSAKMRITGLPILKRIIGIAIRPSDGALIGVGNDSRVYTIDPMTAVATPVSSGPFSPKITDFFDIHFAMALEPNGDRVLLIAAESGGNWSISLADGTAITGETAHYAAGIALQGQTPRLLGLVYPTLSDSAKQPGMCENLAYAIDADEALMLASCDPATGEWWPTGESPEAAAARGTAGDLPSVVGSRTILSDLKDIIDRCGEFMKGLDSPDDTESPGEPEPQEGEQWSPETPADPWYVILLGLGMPNRVGTVEAVDAGEASLRAGAGSAKSVAINWQGNVPSEDPIQTAVFLPGGTYAASKMTGTGRPQFSIAADPEPSTPPAPPSDPRARCG